MFGIECRNRDGIIDNIGESIAFVVHSEFVDFKKKSHAIDPKFIEGEGEFVTVVHQLPYSPGADHTYGLVVDLKLTNNVLTWNYANSRSEGSSIVPCITVFKVVRK